MAMDTYSFQGKHILLTGATGGLGSALAHRLAGMGSHLVVTSRSAKALEELISNLPVTIRVASVTADLSIPGQADTLAAEAVKALGHIDVLFNNAAVGYFALMQETTEETIRYLFELNTFAPLALTKALLAHMKSRGSGRIVNIVSAAGRVPIPSVGVYGGSKSALAIMANTMRLELEETDIDILNIYPGTIDSSFEENALRERSRSGICPEERCGEPKWDVAEQVLKAAQGPSGEVWLDRQGKWLSVGALLWPKLVDQRLKPLRNRVVRRTMVKPRRWRLLQVESAMACNLKCVMCPWTTFRSTCGRGIMEQEVWEAIRPHLAEIRSIDFTGGGEPLLQPRLVEWLGEAHAAGCETGLLTNGLLLTEERGRRLIQAGLDWLCVSIDAPDKEGYEAIRIGSNFEQVCENVAVIGRNRQDRRPKTMINFVMMRSNFDKLEEMVKLAARLGVDQINFKQCDVVREDHVKGLALFGSTETREIKQMQKSLHRARGMAKELGVLTTAFSFTPREKPVCDQDPRDEMFIRYDGNAAPCITLAIGGPTTFLGQDMTMPTVHFGKLPEQDLLDLWETGTCRFFRDRFQDRVNVYDQTFINAADSFRPEENVHEEAVRRMPEASEGCKICHYLYDL